MVITIEGYLIYNFFSFSNKATVTDLETKVTNIMGSLSNFCNSIESISQDLQGHISLAPGTTGNTVGHTVSPLNSNGVDTTESVTSDDLVQCCVNSSNGKMHCETKDNLDLFASGGIPSRFYSYSEPRQCDRCSTGQDTDDTCANYDTNFPNNRCKND